MNVDGYIQFHAPIMNGIGEWFLRSIERCDTAGFHKYLAFDGPSRPYVVTAGTAVNDYLTLVCDTELKAHTELEVYYSFHGAEYPYLTRYTELLGDTVAPDVIESQVMEFE